MLPAQLVVPSTLTPHVVPPPELVQAIRRRGGLVFPLVVRPWEHGRRERYEVVASQEVYSAASEAGLDRLPVIIKRRLTDQQALELMREILLYTGASRRLCEESDGDTGVIRFSDRLRPHKSNHATKAGRSERARVAG